MKTTFLLIVVAALLAPAASAAPVRTDGPNPATRTIARGLDHPWEMAFLPDGSSLVSERPGRLRFVTKDLELSGRVVARFNVSGGEGGLLGVAVDPRFSRNRYVYVFRTTGRGAAVVRYRFVRRRLRSKRTLFGGISVNRIHNGGRLKFGPARRLYLSTGDSAEPSTAQSSGSRNGKFLALSRRKVVGRGGRPTIVSKGHRNPQGFAFSRRRHVVRHRARVHRMRRGERDPAGAQLRLADDPLLRRRPRLGEAADLLPHAPSPPLEPPS